MPLEQQRLAVTHYWALRLWKHSSWWGRGSLCPVELCKPKALPELPPEKRIPHGALEATQGLAGDHASTASSTQALRRAIQTVGGNRKSPVSTTHSGLAPVPGSCNAGLCSSGTFFLTKLEVLMKKKQNQTMMLENVFMGAVVG